jgi:hypothetical protein
MNHDLETARFNLAMQQIHSNWYDHIDQVDAAMHQSAADWAVRHDYGWEGDEGGEWGPNPLQPDDTILESKWEEELGLPFPEDFKYVDSYVYELMLVIGKYKHDPAVMAHMLALRAADFLGNLGQPEHGSIRSSLRNSYIVQQHADD